MNNQVVLLGSVIKMSKCSEFYMVSLSVCRESGTEDLIPVMIPEKLVSGDLTGKTVGIKGHYRSQNRHDEDKTRLILNVYAERLDICDNCKHINDVFLEGYLTKAATIRYTPKERRIAEIMLAVNDNSRTDYIPCIIWDNMLACVEGLQEGDCIRIAGRIQSRSYTKDGAEKTAYEVSADLIELM